MTRSRILFPHTPDDRGVYQIRNTVNGRLYIGSTKHMRTRWVGHFTELQRGKHHNYYLQLDWSQMGADAFAFDVLILGGTRNDEERIIQSCRTYDLQYGYNQDRVYGQRPARRPERLIARLTWLELAK